MGGERCGAWDRPGNCRERCVSNEAITWALSQPVKHSSAKFVLVVMANHADAVMKCWPSVSAICAQTAQDRKTVLENIRRLREAGFIEDTGARKGSTGQVIVYRLKDAENGTVDNAQPVDATQDNKPENGTVKESQKRNSTENGTVPFFPSNSPVFPYKQSQISLETVPKTGHGTLMEPSKETTLNLLLDEHKFDPAAVLDRMGVPGRVIADWLKHRKSKRGTATMTVIEHRFEAATQLGWTLTDVLKTEINRNWQGFEVSWLQPKPQAGRPVAPAQTQERRVSDNDEARRLAFGKKQREVIDV